MNTNVSIPLRYGTTQKTKEKEKFIMELLFGVNSS